MNKKTLSPPSQDERQNAFKKSNELHENITSHYEAVSKEKPELAHLFVKHTKMISLCGYENGMSEYISGYFNMNTCREYGNYPFIQVASDLLTIGTQPNEGQKVIFNGYIQGGLDMPQVNFENIFLGGVLKNIQTAVNVTLNLQLLINEENIILRLFEGNIYLGDLVSIYQHGFHALIPIEFSGVGSFTYA